MNDTEVQVRYGPLDRVLDFLSRGRYGRALMAEGALRTVAKQYDALNNQHVKTRAELKAAHAATMTAQREHLNAQRQTDHLKALLETAQRQAAQMTGEYARLLADTHHLTLEVVIKGTDRNLPYPPSNDMRQEADNIAFAEEEACTTLGLAVHDAAMVSAFYDRAYDQYVAVATLTVSQFLHQLQKDYDVQVSTVDARTAKASAAPDPLAEAHGGAVEVLPPPEEVQEELKDV